LPLASVGKGLVIGSAIMVGSWLAKRWVLKLEAAQFRGLIEGMLLLAGLTMLWRRSTRSMGAAPRVRMTVGHGTCVMRRSVLYLSINMRCGHLRGRVTAVGRQLEVLFTTQSGPVDFAR
jgi:hypothetical protein